MQMMTAVVERVMNTKGVLTLDYLERTFAFNRQLRLSVCLFWIYFVFHFHRKNHDLPIHLHACVCVCVLWIYMYMFHPLISSTSAILNRIIVGHHIKLCCRLCVAFFNYSSWNGSTAPIIWNASKNAMAAFAIAMSICRSEERSERERERGKKRANRFDKERIDYEPFD